MIKNIVFDIGDVLVKFMPEASVRYAGVDEKEVDNVLAATVGSRWWAELDRGIMDEEEVITKMIEESPKYKEAIRRFFDDGKELLVEAFDYSEKWIADMKSRGYKVYLLSNYPRSYFLLHSETRMPFVKNVDGKVVSAFVKYVKPEPEIYRILLDTYRLVPSECVFIDDREDNVDGAVKAGMHGIVFKNYVDANTKLDALLEDGNKPNLISKFFNKS